VLPQAPTLAAAIIKTTAPIDKAIDKESARLWRSSLALRTISILLSAHGVCRIMCIPDAGEPLSSLFFQSFLFSQATTLTKRPNLEVLHFKVENLFS